MELIFFWLMCAIAAAVIGAAKGAPASAGSC